MIYTDNSETLKNALAKIAELETKLKLMDDLELQSHYFRQNLETKLAIAIEALEIYALGSLYPNTKTATEALNKIRSE